MVAQGYKQEEGIDYDEVFAPIAKVEAIRLFFAFASFMNFLVYQMDVKSAFLYGTIEEDVYVCQPLGFVDLEFPEKVYKVEKALYGLHQAPRACYVEKENGLQILQSIDQGPFELGTTGNTLGTTPEVGVLLGPERPRTYDDLSDTEKKRYDADVRATNIVLQGLPKDIYKLINHNIEAKAIWDNVKMLLAGSELTKEDTESQLYDEFERFKLLPGENINEYYVRFYKLVNDMRNIRMTMPNIQLNSKFVNNGSPEWDSSIENGAVLDEEELLFLAGKQANTFDADVDNQPIQYLALNEDNIFQADKCDDFDSDVDDEPTAQSIFMANLSSAKPANLQGGPSNASILSEVHILENAIDHRVTNQDEHEIHNEVQQENVIDSTSDDMGNSIVILYEQYLSVNNVSVVPSYASSVLNDACMLSDNDANVPHDPIATELNIYKEQVAIY
ncbi:putative zinc finger, CCHC-type containing protein [Tanacetum coccineum]